MSDFNIASKSKDEQDKVHVDLAASGVAYKERLNMPVVAEAVTREQPELVQFTRVFHGARPLLPRAEYPATPRIRSALHRDGQLEREKIAIFSPMLILLLSPGRAIITWSA